jgi:hypothetical protein
MRELRPEYYSDTQSRDAYILDQTTLEYHLDTLTSRNQTHDFEIFARKLCERAICPNLRPQTGPEGGGDSKADSETFSVAPEISVTYIGEIAGGSERWAFAFSAKKKWKEKARNDVKGIVETGRNYKKIICVTSQFARAKDRADLEDKLSKEFGIPVTIHDRAWIVKEVIENDRKDLAFNYLGVGQAVTVSHRLGPTDYSRSQQLADIEKTLGDLEAFRGMETQRVTEALVAAKLSRGLEQPRVEIDGRFVRAIRLADADGNYRQRLEARYEQIWTGFWWFDDFDLLKAAYGDFEKEALKSDHSANVAFLCNLHQLLVNSVVYGHMTREACDLDKRTATLRQALEKIANNKERPNNALEAETSILIIRMNEVVLNEKPDELQGVWRDFMNVLERAAGLGEFKAERLGQMIEIGGRLAGNDAVYNELVEKLADFVSKRSSEAEGSLILLKRAKQLDFADRIEMIRLLGKAAYGLTKKEYADQLIEATQHLAVAYRSAGLLWAARAACVFAIARIAIEGEEESTIPVIFLPTVKLWGWIALSLRHLPDVLSAIQLLNGALQTLPLTDDSKERLENDIRELEYGLACILLNLTDDEVRKLEGVPDILEGLELFAARSALLYTLGHSDVLREDGSLPATESDEVVNESYSLLASQPLAKQTRGVLIVNGTDRQCLTTSILGMRVEVYFEGSDTLTLVAEAILGSLEAFFATAIEERVIAHTEKFKISLIESAEVSEPTVVTEALDMEAFVRWPHGLSVVNYARHAEMRSFFVEVSANVLATTMVIDDVTAFIDKLYDDEGAQRRMAMIATAANSYHRVMSRYVSRLPDWKEAVRRQYPAKAPRPQLKLVDIPVPESDDEDDVTEGPEGPISHQAIRVQSVIDTHAWDRAQWKATGFLQYRERPGIALVFKDEVAAKKIFERWRERFGNDDAKEEIHLAIIKNLPEQDPHHYIVMVTSKSPEAADLDPKQSVVFATRSMTMTPPNSSNLERFLTEYGTPREFYLMPAIISPQGALTMFHDVAILKRAISVKDAKDLGPNDVEGLALRLRSPEARGCRATPRT